MRAIAILPARLGASRFPGKPLALINGIPMLGHCYFRTRMCPGLLETFVATCDSEIADYVRSMGGKVVMTANTHTRAATRTAEAMLTIERDLGPVDAVVMVQGDEPLITPDVVGDALRGLEDPSVDIVNVMSRLRTEREFRDPNNVKVVVDASSNALYMSREPIPSPWRGAAGLPMYMQVGVIGFRRNALLKFNGTPETALERIESVDMNRILETGGSIRMIPIEMRTIGVDTPAELEAAAAILKNDELVQRYPGRK